MEEVRRWEDMPSDGLAKIFQRLSLEDMTLNVPFVCKSWHKASYDPSCWQVLDLREVDFSPWSNLARKFTEQYPSSTYSFIGLFKHAVHRSCGSAIELKFPRLLDSSISSLAHASEECPKLKVIVLPTLMSTYEMHIPELVCKWKDLEWLEMESKPRSFLQMVKVISLNCKSFVSLKMSGLVTKEDAAAIVDYLPKLKYLNLTKSYMHKEQLMVIMDGCKELEMLDVTKCYGFDVDDHEVLKRAAHIKTFECKGSKLMCEDYDSDEEIAGAGYIGFAFF